MQDSSFVLGSNLMMDYNVIFDREHSRASEPNYTPSPPPFPSPARTHIRIGGRVGAYS